MNLQGEWRAEGVNPQVITSSIHHRYLRHDCLSSPCRVINMPDRFYLPLPFPTATVEIDGTEAHHMLGVLRKKTGDVVELFDGMGTAVLAEIGQTKKRSATLHIQKVVAQEIDEPMPRITLATTDPKGERFRWLIEKATEIGISKIIPLQTTRSVVNPRSAKIDKMRAATIAACKQCGRNRLMELSEPITWEKLFETTSPQTIVAVGDRNGTDLLQVVENIKKLSSKPDDITLHPSEYIICIGPEGGLTEEETELAVKHAAHLVKFGRNILRIETAALVLGTVWVHNFSVAE